MRTLKQIKQQDGVNSLKAIHIQADEAKSELAASRCSAQRRAEIDAAFVRAGHKPENKDCDHRQYDSTKHGRYCPCGTCMWDAGD